MPHDIDRPRPVRSAVRWGPTFLGFPVAGLLARAVAGPVDSVEAGLLAGAVAGMVLGAVQSLGAGPAVRRPGLWVVASAAGLAVGLGLGATIVDWQTDLGSLALQGAVSGLALGAAQAPFLAVTRLRARLWPFLLAALWALGWTTTTLVGVDVETRWAVFGASGALVVTIGTGLVLLAPSTRLPRSPCTNDPQKRPQEPG